MPDKFEIAAALRDMGLLLKAKGENAFKAKAYITGARSLVNSLDDVETLIKEERLQELPGIGASLERVIIEYFNTGECEVLNELRSELPPGTAELSLVDGMTIKRIKLLYDALNISSIAELEAAIRDGTIASVKGFNAKLQESLLRSIESLARGEEQIRLVDALEITFELLEFLRASLKADVQCAGGIRRWEEAVDRITLIADAEACQIEKLVAKFPGTSSVESIDDRVTANLSNRVPLEIFAVNNMALGLIVHTGTPSHFQQLQRRAVHCDLTLDPLCFQKGDNKIECESEADVFKQLNLNFIPAELRHGEGEVELAERDDFRYLVNLNDIRGMTHCHSTFSDGVNTIEQMARAAQKMGMEYITLTDHSPTAHYAKGLDLDRLKEQWEEIDRVQELVDIKILKGTECDILADGQLDYPDHILEKFDIIIASIHSRYRQGEDLMTRRLLNGLTNPVFKVWGHPLGRLVLRRDPIPCNVLEILEAIASANVAIEINGDPYRLDLAPNWAKEARKLGLKFVVSTDAHSVRDLENLPFGIHMARRAGLSKDDVLNTLPVEGFTEAVRPV